MTEDKKQELAQLLHGALRNLEIRQRSANRSQLPAINVHEYGTLLQQSWTSHSLNLLSVVMSYEIHIANEVTKSKFLDFIREEFAPSIHEDRIQSASFFIFGSGTDVGWPLDYLLDQLLKIAIVLGIERAVSDFEKCAQNTPGSFQYIALVEGITVDTEMQIFEGIKLVLLPNSSTEFPNYLPNLPIPGLSVDFRGKTLLIIDCSVSPVFHKPFPELFREGLQRDHLPFQVEVTGGGFPNFKVSDFYVKFNQSLSLACNSPVQISLKWQFLAEDELFNLNFGMRGMEYHLDALGNSLFGHSIQVGQAQIDEAKRLYEILGNLDSDVTTKLQIPIERWIKSKAERNPVDRIIDLGIAFEAFYLPDISETTELSFRLRLRASWYLGKDKTHRKELMKDFSQIYEWRSKVVHTGKLPNKTRRTPFTPEEVEAFMTKAQNLCRDSIMKILEAGEFPDWNDLILG